MCFIIYYIIYYVIHIKVAISEVGRLLSLVLLLCFQEICFNVRSVIIQALRNKAYKNTSECTPVLNHSK